MPAGERLVPPMTAQPEPSVDPNLPFRGMASNGAPVMAGPPAYRWYGYGAVTPGSNQYAPTGQYPKGSSNWYGVTGATPGAFPVPVVNPYRSEPGNEPPSYVANPPVRTPIIEQPRNVSAPVPSSFGVRPSPGTSPKPEPSPVGIPAMPPIQSIGTAAPAPKSSALPPLPQPVGIPAIPMMPPTPTTPKPEPLSTAPAKPIIGTPVMLTKPATQTAPDALPPALTNDPSWKPTPAAAPIPVLPPPDLFLEPGAKIVKNEIIARGQMPDNTRDPATALIQGVCKGRAEGVDVRWNNNRKLTVCFEVKSQADAGKLVKDISARPELAPFAIDFCVLVK